MIDLAQVQRCLLCQLPIYINDPYVVLPPGYDERLPHVHHLNCWLKKYNEAEHE